MDKKNLTIGVTLLLAAGAVLVFGPHSPPPTTNAPATIAAPAINAPSSASTSTQAGNAAAAQSSAATTPVTSNATTEYATVRPEPGGTWPVKRPSPTRRGIVSIL